MAGGKQTPRQAMIGLMYLVLLAMLAMQASKDLLDAFTFLENGIGVTSENFELTNGTIYDKINEAAALKSQKAIEVKNKADEIKSKADSLFSKIEQLKKEIIEESGGVDEETGIPLAKDNQDIGAEFLLTYGKGLELKNALADFKTYLNSCIAKDDTSLINSVSKLLDTPDGDQAGTVVSWESIISEHLPMAAVTANLSNVQSYVKNAEAQVINYLYEDISADVYKVNKIMATTLAKSSYVLQGDEYRANVFLAASDTTQEPIILVGEYDTALYRQSGIINFLGKVDSLPVNGGVGSLAFKTNEIGNHKWGGIMKVPHPNPKMKGKYFTYPFESTYTVAAPSAVISSKDLNIMYGGVDNNMQISAPGIASDKISVVTSPPSGVKKIKDGEFAIKPRRLGPISISVFAEINGEKVAMGTQKWMVKRFPKPEIKIGNKTEPAKIRLSHLKAFKSINVKYPDDFPISAKPTIVKCLYEINRGSTPLGDKKMDNSGKFTNAQLSAIKVGDILNFTVSTRDPAGVGYTVNYSVTVIR